ncbi:MAG: hypothetical protein ACD_11C00057G0020 [uncultured bacterium]|nr:MAG: hypothetical protein ACD_11C00057G0020 [uncultured bacterium]HBR71783.1 hypothetical protein [Candidatus Moranbacteria bacterium]
MDIIMENRFGNKFETQASSEKYESAVDVLEEFGGHKGLKKVVAEKMQKAKIENIQINSDDFIKFVLGYCIENIKKPSVLEILKNVINGIVEEIEKEKEIGARIEDKNNGIPLKGNGSKKEINKIKNPEETSGAVAEEDPSNKLSDYEYFLAFGRHRNKIDDNDE